jgi:atypical dual specificity phosphatase
MLFRPLPLPPHAQGRLWLHAMPGRMERWPDFEAEAARVRLDTVVCLCERDEIDALSPVYAQMIDSDTLGRTWLHLPLRNYGGARDTEAFKAGVADLARRLESGESMLLHCAAGIGRTGTAAACVLKRLGLPTAQALAQVRAAGSRPESALQSGLIDAI